MKAFEDLAASTMRSVVADGIQASRRRRNSAGSASSSLHTDSCESRMVGGIATAAGDRTTLGRGLVIGTPLWNGVRWVVGGPMGWMGVTLGGVARCVGVEVGAGSWMGVDVWMAVPETNRFSPEGGGPHGVAYVDPVF
jgi:hypothetical protein